MAPDFRAAAAAAQGIAAGWDGGPGGAFVLFDTQGVRAGAAGGLASLEHSVAFTTDTPSRYASISKHFLATALLLAGTRLDQPLDALLPGLRPALGAVELVRALDMTGGLPDMMEVMWQQGVPFTATLGREAIAAVLHRLDGTSTKPGTEMAYSNTGWRLGQSVLEAKLGLPYAEALQQLLLGPLGLDIVFPYDETEPVAGLATGYWQQDGRWKRGRYGMHISASGALAGSAAALGGWAAALIAGRGPLAGMLDRLLAPRAFADGAASAYRLGLVETRLGAVRLAGHSGSLPGYRNQLLMAPDLGVGVALLLNRDEGALLPALQVMAALVNQVAPEPVSGLPHGLYAAAEGPAWAALVPGGIEFMGAAEALVAGPEGWLHSLPSTLEAALRIEDGVIHGRIGGVARRLLAVPQGLALDPALAGLWREEGSGAELLIRQDGSARWPWAGVGQEVALTPLPGRRALAALPHLMWQHRPCLTLDAEGRLCLASHRARVLRFHRR